MSPEQSRYWVLLRAQDAVPLTRCGHKFGGSKGGRAGPAPPRRAWIPGARAPLGVTALGAVGRTELLWFPCPRGSVCCSASASQPSQEFVPILSRKQMEFFQCYPFPRLLQQRVPAPSTAQRKALAMPGNVSRETGF